MKLPNYYGSISKLSGNRRKPYMVRISSEAEYDEEKKDFIKKRITLGYYKTKKEAFRLPFFELFLFVPRTYYI